MGYYLEEEESEKWYDSSEFHKIFISVLIALFLIGVFIFGSFLAKEALERAELLNQNRESTLSSYFGSQNIMIIDSYIGSNRYEVLTEKGLYVVELNEESSAVVKALPMVKE